MEKRKKASIISAVALALVVSLAAGLFMQRSGLTPSYLVFALDSNPDERGNYIYYVRVDQYSGGSWSVYKQIDIYNYTSDMTVEIDANYLYRLTASVFLNGSLADDCPDAVSKTRVYFSVTDEFTNDLGENTDCSVWPIPVGDDYMVAYRSTKNWTATSDSSYDCTVKYEAYY